jgi:hypothetical protein
MTALQPRNLLYGKEAGTGEHKIQALLLDHSTLSSPIPSYHNITPHRSSRPRRITEWSFEGTTEIPI